MLVLGLLVVAVAGLFVALLILERLRPLRAARHTLAHGLLVNLAMSVLAYGAAAAVRPVIAAAMGWAAQRRFGLAYLLPLPAVACTALAFLAMDLSFYYWHRLNHVVPLLWRFHNVHHTDPALGVSTSFRFHAGEVALSVLFRAAQVTLIGIGPATYALYELAFQCNTLFHHSNLRLPRACERRLNRVLVTPRMHGIHHSQIREEDLSNFSVVLSCWDRLHGTLRLDVPQSRIKIGIAGYSRPEDNTFWALLAMPFRPQRDYWTGPDGAVLRRDPQEREPAP
jgi:sterol desaturase/sphingolipid hydroxylase (fatty acid hydroxylase superfamily)